MRSCLYKPLIILALASVAAQTGGWLLVSGAHHVGGEHAHVHTHDNETHAHWHTHGQVNEHLVLDGEMDETGNSARFSGDDHHHHSDHTIAAPPLIVVSRRHLDFHSLEVNQATPAAHRADVMFSDRFSICLWKPPPLSIPPDDLSRLRTVILLT